jgi:hypothetical protein
MENHPGKQYNHKTYGWLFLGLIIRERAPAPGGRRDLVEHE